MIKLPPLLVLKLLLIQKVPLGKKNYACNIVIEYKELPVFVH